MPGTCSGRCSISILSRRSSKLFLSPNDSLSSPRYSFLPLLRDLYCRRKSPSQSEIFKMKVSRLNQLIMWQSIWFYLTRPSKYSPWLSTTPPTFCRMTIIKLQRGPNTFINIYLSLTYVQCRRLRGTWSRVDHVLFRIACRRKTGNIQTSCLPWYISVTSTCPEKIRHRWGHSHYKCDSLRRKQRVI